MSTPTPRDDRWILRSRELLQAQAAQPDPALQRRLNAAWQQALAAATTRRGGRWLLPLVLTGAAATAALVLALGMSGSTPLPTEVAPEQPAQVAQTPIDQALTLPDEDLQLIADPEDLALLEDLEFYAWLESAEHDG